MVWLTHIGRFVGRLRAACLEHLLSTLAKVLNA